MPQDMEQQSIRSVIVDDDKAIGEVLKELISKGEVSVEVFGDGLEATEYFRKQPVDIVITDLMMPRVGGLEVLRHAKASNPDVIVIIITGHASLETAIEAVREGAYDYIRKPFNLQEMGIAFDNAVEKVHLVRENRKLLRELNEAYDQLVTVKKEKREFKDEHKTLEERIARLNFFSDSIPSLQFLNNCTTGQRDRLEELHRLSALKKEGLLTEREFKALKAHLIKGLQAHA